MTEHVELEFKTLSGVWVSYNLFIDDDGVEHKVAPYKNLGDVYKDLFPVHCYIMLHGTAIKNIVEKDLNSICQ